MLKRLAATDFDLRSNGDVAIKSLCFETSVIGSLPISGFGKWDNKCTFYILSYTYSDKTEQCKALSLSGWLFLKVLIMFFLLSTMLSPDGYKSLLTLKVPITTAADDTFCNVEKNKVWYLMRIVCQQALFVIFKKEQNLKLSSAANYALKCMFMILNILLK